jgi:hypothetical protein
MPEDPTTMENFFEKIARTTNRGLAVLGARIPGLLLAAVKLDLALLFFWYTWELFWEPTATPWIVRTMIAAPALLIVIFGAWCFFAALRGEFKRTNPPPFKRGGVGPFLLLNVIPLLAIGVQSYWNATYHFSSPLLVQTQYLIKSVIGSLQ